MLKSSKYPKIIYIYFTKDFFQYFLLTLISLATLIFFIDLIELFRRSSNKVGINFLQIASFYDIIGMAGLKIPSNVEKIIPFATLIGSIICFNQWRKKNYYIISRTSGISLWKTISPILVSSFFVGLTSIILLNPFSALLNKKFYNLQSLFFGQKDLKTFSFVTEGFWIKQVSQKKSLIINANKINEKKNKMIDVKVYVFDQNKIFEKKLSAKEGFFNNSKLNLKKVNIINKDSSLQNLKNYSFLIKSNSSDLNIAIAEPNSIFILDLPSYIYNMKKHGLNISGHLLHFFKLICQPFLIISMILLSASLMLRSSERKVEVGIISISLVMGFSLYFIGDFIFALGSSERLPPLLSGFGPTLIGLFAGCYLISDIDEPKTVWNARKQID